MGRGTEAGRMLYGSHYLDSPDNPPPLGEHLPANGDGGGTFNHGFLLAMNGYVSGSPRGRDMLKEGLELQREGGHCTRGPQIETNSASHCQLNEAAAGVSLYHAVKVKDGPVVELLRDWWWSEMVLCNEMAIPGQESRPFDNRNAKKGDRQPDVWGPGWRAMQKGKLVGSNAGRDASWRVIYGRPMPGPKHRMWTQRYYLAARALLMLPEMELKALRPAPGFQPPLPYDLEVRHWPDGSFASAWQALPVGDVALYGGWFSDSGLFVGNEEPVPDDDGFTTTSYPGLRPLAQEGGPA